MPDGNNRSLKPAVAERIRSRASGGDGSRGDNGISDGNRGSDNSAAGSSATDSGESERRDSPTIDSTGRTPNADTGGIRIVGSSSNGRTNGTIGDDGNSSGGDSDRRTVGGNEIIPLASADSSRRVNLTEIMTDSPEGIRIIKPGGTRGRKPGTKNATTKKKTVDYSDIIFPLRIALDFVFGIPVKLGWGKHWELSDTENEDLSTCIKDVLEQFPSDTTTDFIKALEKFIPLLTLGITLYDLVSSRLKETKRLATAQQQQLFENAEVKRTEESRTPISIN